MLLIRPAAMLLALWFGGSQALAYDLACYGTDLPIEGGEIKALRFSLPPMSQADEGAAARGSIQYWGFPDVTLTGLASCSGGDGTTMHCYTDCSTGGIHFRQLDSNSVLAVFEDFGFSGDFASETSRYSDPEIGLSAALVLSLLEDPVCSLPKSSAGLRVVLMPGDVSPYVEQAKTALSIMGYPIESIDRIFDRDARESLQAFQASIGLPATGYLDAETLKLLKVHAPGSGC